LTRPEIAAIRGEKDPYEPAGSFKRVLAGLIEAEQVEKAEHRRYRLTDDGRAVVGLSI